MINDNKLDELRALAHEAMRKGVDLYPELSIPDARLKARMTINAAELVTLIEEVKSFRRVRMLTVEPCRGRAALED
jgi:hypothetical protein